MGTVAICTRGCNFFDAVPSERRKPDPNLFRFATMRSFAFRQQNTPIRHANTGGGMTLLAILVGWTLISIIAGLLFAPLLAKNVRPRS